jgi:hypothetical protein
MDVGTNGGLPKLSDREVRYRYVKERVGGFMNPPYGQKGFQASVRCDCCTSQLLEFFKGLARIQKTSGTNSE